MFVVELEQDGGVAARTVHHAEGSPATTATVSQDVGGAVFMVAASAFPLTEYGNSFTTVGAA